jgi:hypothetical protein
MPLKIDRSAIEYYGIENFSNQIVNYRESFLEELGPKLPSERQLESWHKHGFYIGHYTKRLGDMLSYTVVPKYLKQHYPGVKVYFAGKSFATTFFRNDPYVDAIVERPEHELFGSGREFGFGTTTQRRLRSFGIFTVDPVGPEVIVSDQCLARWQEWKAKLPLDGRKLVVIQSSGRTNPKIFSFWTWLKYLRSLREEFYFVQIGNLRDQFIWTDKMKLGQWDMEDLAGILKATDVFMGPNSGVMHLASAVGANSVILHNEAKGSELMFPVLGDNWLLPKQVNHHVFHTYPWHHHLVIEDCWDLPSDKGLFCNLATFENLRSTLRLATSGPNSAWLNMLHDERSTHPLRSGDIG